MLFEASKDVSVVIPTYCREEVLINTVFFLINQNQPANKIILVDQTPQHQITVEKQLSTWAQEGIVQWIKLEQPSITHAMNVGLNAAKTPIVLFLDDDIIPSNSLVVEHAKCYEDEAICAVVGQVLQPKQEETHELSRQDSNGIWSDLGFKFNSSRSGYVNNCMAGNLSVRRDLAIAAGGMNENFIGVAYRFETEFAKRFIAYTGKQIRYEPKATLNHLQATSGGTRTKGGHLNSVSSDHSVGDYYYAFLQSKGFERLKYMSFRFLRSVRTRYHLTHPWWIPVKLLGEVRGFLLAMRLYKAT